MISVSGIFTPVRSNWRILVDGGLTNPVPVSVSRAMGADIVIAVDLNHEIIAGKNMKPLLPAGNASSAEVSSSGTLSRWAGDYRLSMTNALDTIPQSDGSWLVQCVVDVWHINPTVSQSAEGRIAALKSDSECSFGYPAENFFGYPYVSCASSTDFALHCIL